MLAAQNVSARFCILLYSKPVFLGKAYRRGGGGKGGKLGKLPAAG